MVVMVGWVDAPEREGVPVVVGESVEKAKITLSDSFPIGVQTCEPPPIRAHWPALAKDTGKRLDRKDSPIETVHAARSMYVARAQPPHRRLRRRRPRRAHSQSIRLSRIR